MKMNSLNLKPREKEKSISNSSPNPKCLKNTLFLPLFFLPIWAPTQGVAEKLGLERIILKLYLVPS